MTAGFAPVFAGELAVYGDRFVLESEEPSPSPGTDLVDHARLSRLLDRFAERRYPGGDRRAVASLWAKQHFATLLPPFLAIALIGGQEVDLSLDAIGCTFSADGVTARIHLRDSGWPATAAGSIGGFMSLIEGHLEPLIAALAAAGGVSRKVLWSNAGNMFDFIVRRIERMIGASAPVGAALALMESRRLPGDGRPNPLFDPVRYGDGRDPNKRLRRLCCLRYLIPDLGYCSACPLPAAREASS